MRIDVNSNQRVLVLENGRPTRWLAPGRFHLFTWYRQVKTRTYNASQVLGFDLSDEDLAVVVPGDVRVMELAASERAIVRVDGRPVKWLGEGRHVVLVFGRAVEIETIDVSGVQASVLPRAVASIASDHDYKEVTVAAGCVALRFVDGILDAELSPGKHAAWTVDRAVNFATIDMRERLLAITGQDVMTKDRVSLRLNVSAEIKVVDAKRLATVARDADSIVYFAVQMAGRYVVATRTLDELLRDRDAIAVELESEVRERAEKVGLEVLSVGLKDIILPGEMKELLNRVIEARKEAEANVILRREEISATKALSQTAALLAEHPVLVRLKELEAYKELASNVGTLHVVLGENAAPSIQLHGPK